LYTVLMTYDFMLRLFRRKMIFVVKYFRRNQRKMIYPKIFFGFWLARKNHNNEKQNSAMSNCRPRISASHILAKFTGILPNTAGFRSYWSKSNQIG